jgi:hypothetical protein
MNCRSRSSTSVVMSVAACASVRATMTLGTPATSAASRAALSVRTCCPVGISTLPPRWPHFFSAASWSSQCTPAAPAAIIAVISSYALSTPPNPASASATIGASQSCGASVPSAVLICAARSSALLIRRTTAGTELAG